MTLSKAPLAVPLTHGEAAVQRYAQSVSRDAASTAATLALLSSRVDRLTNSVPLYDLGVAGWDHRFAASRVAGDIGAAVTSLADKGASPTNLTGTGATLADAGDGTPVVEFASGTYTGPVGAAVPGTLAMLVRAANVTGGSFRVQGLGAAWLRPNAGQFQFNDIGAGSGNGQLLVPGDAGWHFIAMSLTNPTSFRIRVDGTDYTAPTSGAWTSGTPDALTIQGQAGFQIAELVTWPTALDATQLNTVRAAMQTAYSIY